VQTEFIECSDGTRLRLGQHGSGEEHVLIVGGLAEHLGRYEHVVAALADAGWRVTVLEPRGHGESGGARGHVQRWEDYLRDFETAAEAIGRPHYLVGHSMGGQIALHASMRGLGPGVLGLALSNPNVAVALRAPVVKVLAARLLSRVWPGLALPNELDAASICRDPDVVRAYREDPLVYSTITPRWYTEMLASQRYIAQHAASCEVPLLMMLGDGDQICDWRASERLAGEWGGPSQVSLYPGLYHELFNEPERAQVLDELSSWLAQLRG